VKEIFLTVRKYRHNVRTFATQQQPRNMTTLSEHHHTTTTQDAEETIVVFRVWRDTGDVIALFPAMHEPGYMVSSYMHTGQHGAADYAHVIAATRPATEQEYENLAAELEDLGYRLRILRKKPIHL
jgi:hypothetical protein